MGAISERIQKQAAVHAIARRSDDEELVKAAERRDEGVRLATAVAEDAYEGEVPEGVMKDIVEDPDWYLEGAGVDIAAAHEGEDADLLPDVQKSEDVEKSYVGFAKLVAKLMSEGHDRDSAERIAASEGRKKYGARFQQAAESGTKLG